MFANKVVIVTGGSAGIGAATAECFAKERASVAIVGRNESRLKEVGQRCETHGAKVLIIRADVSKDEDAKTVVKKTIEEFGRLDVLVNNAGIGQAATILDSNALEVYDKIMNTNLRSVVHLTNLAAPHLKESKGNVVNVSSVASEVIYSSLGAYAISKAGLDHFTKSSAIELAPFGVRVNSVNPGPVATEMLTQPDFIAENLQGSAMADLTLLGRVSDPEEVGDLIMYLASDKARSITGSSYVIDSGMLLK